MSGSCVGMAVRSCWKIARTLEAKRPKQNSLGLCATHPVQGRSQGQSFMGTDIAEEKSEFGSTDRFAALTSAQGAPDEDWFFQDAVWRGMGCVSSSPIDVFEVSCILDRGETRRRIEASRGHATELGFKLWSTSKWPLGAICQDLFGTDRVDALHFIGCSGGFGRTPQLVL